VVVHASRIKRNVSQYFGGGGATCAVPTSGIFALMHSPVFSDYEDNGIGGRLQIFHVRTCWFGALRNRVHGNFIYMRTSLADPDGSEVVSNVVLKELVCFGDVPAVQFGDSHGTPNRAARTSGQCAFKRRQPNPAPSGPLTPISMKKT
jgi:hypothetical protein